MSKDQQSIKSARDIALMQKDIKNINTNIVEIKDSVKALKTSLDTKMQCKADKDDLENVSKSVDKVEGRLWGLVVAVAFEFLGLVTLVIGYFVTK